MVKLKNFLIVIILILFVGLAVGLGFYIYKNKPELESLFRDNKTVVKKTEIEQIPNVHTFSILNNNNVFNSGDVFNLEPVKYIEFETNNSRFFVKIFFDESNSFDYSVDNRLYDFSNVDLTNCFDIEVNNKNLKIRHLSFYDILIRLHPGYEIFVDDIYLNKNYRFNVILVNENNVRLKDFYLNIRFDSASLKLNKGLVII